MSTALPEPGVPPVFRVEDGRVFLETEMPDVVEISEELLEGPHKSPAIELRGTTVEFRLANSRYVFRILERSEAGTVLCEILYREDPE